MLPIQISMQQGPFMVQITCPQCHGEREIVPVCCIYLNLHAIVNVNMKVINWIALKKKNHQFNCFSLFYGCFIMSLWKILFLQHKRNDGWQNLSYKRKVLIAYDGWCKVYYIIYFYPCCFFLLVCYIRDK